MKSEGVAVGDIFKNISEGNTTIVNYQLSIIHYKRGKAWRAAGLAAPAMSYETAREMAIFGAGRVNIGRNNTG